MLINCVLVLHNNVVNPNNHPDRLGIEEIGLVGRNLGLVLFIVQHILKSLHVAGPILGRAVKLQSWWCARDLALVTEFGGRMVLRNNSASAYYFSVCSSKEWQKLKRK